MSFRLAYSASVSESIMFSFVIELCYTGADTIEDYAEKENHDVY